MSQYDNDGSMKSESAGSTGATSARRRAQTAKAKAGSGVNRKGTHRLVDTTPTGDLTWDRRTARGLRAAFVDLRDRTIIDLATA